MALDCIHHKLRGMIAEKIGYLIDLSLVSVHDPNYCSAVV